MAARAKQKVTRWAWSTAKRDAARLLAEDELTDQQIGERVGTSRVVLWRWKCVPEFAAEVARVRQAIGDASVRYAVGRRTNRVRALDERWQAMRRVIDERGADPTMADVPGGRTGLLVRTVKGIGGGENWREVEEYAVDTGLLHELREHEQQAARELGQWVEKQETRAAGEVVIKILGHGLSLKDLQ